VGGGENEVQNLGDLKVAPTIFLLSPLLAHTSTTDRNKSFISIHIAK